MSERVKAEDLGTALGQELGIYGESVIKRLQEVTRSSMKVLVAQTKASAPVGKRNGKYKRSITADYTGTRGRSRKVAATWYVKAPDYRLTHLLVHGHVTKNGGRTRANPFLQEAVDKVLPEYERAVEEVLRNGK